MKSILLGVTCLWIFGAFTQTTNDQVTITRDYSLAKVGFKIHGVYVFVMAEPYFPYDFIETINVKLNWTGTMYESFEKVIKKAQKNYTNFNGIIFQKENLSKADLIRFNELEVAKGGFTIGSKVSFIEDGIYKVGEIVKLGIGKEDFSVRYITPSGAEKIVEVAPIDLTPISEETYNEKVNSIATTTNEIKEGDRVSWKSGMATFEGEVIEIEGDFAKIRRSSGVVNRIKISELTKI